ncbi:MAG: alpha-amylase/4-alpha-glucanotransferase domain-containing protein, partial [Candidatus Kryptoniota bacterium]
HKKMNRLSERAHKLERRGIKVDRALDKIWAAQCNDPYWHGVFGGLYLPNLRYPVYKSLIQAENELDRLEKKSGLSVSFEDFDLDGSKEVLVESSTVNAYFKPDEGASLFELDYKPAAFNFLDIVSRRPEGYHKKLTEHPVDCENGEGIHSIHDMVIYKEEGLEKLLYYDWYRRASFVDHFIGNTSLEEFASAHYEEQGNFVAGAYECDFQVSREKDRAVVTFTRNGIVRKDGRDLPIKLLKRFFFFDRKPLINCEYKITNLGENEIDLNFGVEFNFGLLAGDAHDRYYLIDGKKPSDSRLRSKGESYGVSAVSVVDEWQGIYAEVNVDKPQSLWRFPIETVSLSESGFERVYQSSVIFFHSDVTLQREYSVNFSLILGRLRSSVTK